MKLNYILDLSCQPLFNNTDMFYTGHKFVDDLDFEIGTKFDCNVSKIAIDVTEPINDSLIHFLDNCDCKLLFIISNLSYKKIDHKALKSKIEFIQSYKYRTVLMLADYDRENRKDDFSIEKEINSFSLEDTGINFFAISDIWFRKYFNAPAPQAPNFLADRYYFSNKEVIDICSTIIDCFIQNKEKDIPALLHAKIHNK